MLIGNLDKEYVGGLCAILFSCKFSVSLFPNKMKGYLGGGGSGDMLLFS